MVSAKVSGKDATGHQVSADPSSFLVSRPQSGGLVLEDTRSFERINRVIVTEKLDGENTTLYRTHLHPRSLDSGSHPARTWLKAFHAGFSYRIPEDSRICGENVFARHSIGNDALTSFFYVFAVYHNNLCLDWEESRTFCSERGLVLVPVLYDGVWDEEAVKACKRDSSTFGPTQESFVVRSTSTFMLDRFSAHGAKYVRAGHVDTDDHWMNMPVVPNRLVET